MTDVWIPLTPSDVPALEKLLKSADPFVTSTIDTTDPYRLLDYVQHSIEGHAELAAVLDRNLVSRIAQLAEGRLVDHSKPGSDADRIAAACMAFLITADVLTEPNISLYELSESLSETDGLSQLASFRIADHLHPQAYLEVALQRAPGIHPDVIEEARALVSPRNHARDQIDLQVPLRHWRRHRCALTKIAQLERNPLAGAHKFRSLLEWSVDPGFFDGIAIALAARLFGRSSPHGKLLKSVRAQAPKKCFAGIRNTAWDLTYISHWVSRSSEEANSRIWILCTYDRALRDLARVAVGEESAVGELFTRNWRASEAKELERHYRDAWMRAQRSESRVRDMRPRFEQIDTLRESIEKKIESAF